MRMTHFLCYFRYLSCESLMSGIYQLKQGLWLILAQHKSPGDYFSFGTTSFRCPVRTLKLEEVKTSKFLSEKQDFYDVSGMSDAEQERRYYVVFGKNLSVYPNKGALTADTKRKCPYISAQDISVCLSFCRFLTPSVSLRLSSVLSLPRAVTIPFILPSASLPLNGRLVKNYDQVIKLNEQTAF